VIDDWCSSGIKSPHILELSGIGRRNVLEQIGVDVKVELPGVGENVQEHPTCGSTYETNPGVAYETVDLMRDPDYAAERLKFQWVTPLFVYYAFDDGAFKC
jgi:choline dehydrogenase-like flavoprotein